MGFKRMKCAGVFWQTRQLWTTLCIYNSCFFLIFQPVAQKGSSTAGEEQKQKPGRTSSVRLATKTGITEQKQDNRTQVCKISPETTAASEAQPAWLPCDLWMEIFSFIPKIIFLISIKLKCCTKSVSQYTHWEIPDELKTGQWLTVHKRFVLAVLFGILVKAHCFGHIAGSKGSKRPGRSLT